MMDLDEIQKAVNARVVSVPMEYQSKKDPTKKYDFRQQPRGIDQLRKKVFFFQQ